MKPLKKIIDTLIENHLKPKNVVTLEMVEICDITEKLIDRLDNKIKALKAIETQADQKIAILDGLITKCKHMDLSGNVNAATPKGHRSEVQTLASKGFKSEQIARILDLPSGEVELILNLVH
jgi:hypothetical protein